MKGYRETVETLVAVCGENGIDDQRILDACRLLEGTAHFTFGLPAREAEYVRERAASLDVGETHVIRQAVRIYQLWQRYPQLGEECCRLMEAEFGASPGCAGEDG